METGRFGISLLFSLSHVSILISLQKLNKLTEGLSKLIDAGEKLIDRIISGAAEGNETHTSKRRKRRYGREENVGFGVHKIVCGPLLLRFTLVYSGLVWFGLVDFS